MEELDRQAGKPPPFHLGQRPFGRLARFGVGAWTVVGTILAGYLLLRILAYVDVLVLPLLLAGVIVMVLDPLVSWLAGHGWPRLAGTSACYLAVIGVLTLLGWVFLPGVVESARQLVTQGLPQALNQVQAFAEQVASRFGFQLNLSQGSLAELVRSNRDTIMGWLTGLGGFLGSALQVAGYALIALVIGFYILVELPRLRRVTIALLPPSRREELRSLAGSLHHAVGGYIRGQLLVAAYVGVASALALWIIGVPYALVIGAFAGVTNLIPFIGPWVGAIVAVTTALVAGHLWQALWAALALLLVQQVDNHLITPNVMRWTVQLDQLVVLLALLVLGSLWGLLGALIAVPFVGALRIIFEYVWLRTVPYGQDLVVEDPT